jgi:hypothetical protein
MSCHWRAGEDWQGRADRLPGDQELVLVAPVEVQSQYAGRGVEELMLTASELDSA